MTKPDFDSSHDPRGYDGEPGPQAPERVAEPGEQPPGLPDSSYPPDATPIEPAPATTLSGDGDHDPELVAAVTAHQLLTCREVVPEALAIRLQHAAQVPAGQWRRTAGADDPEVQRLEAPHRLVPVASDDDPAGDDATGSRRR